MHSLYIKSIAAVTYNSEAIPSRVCKDNTLFIVPSKCTCFVKISLTFAFPVAHVLYKAIEKSTHILSSKTAHSIYFVLYVLCLAEYVEC